jgi:hypothetical protein
MLGSLGTTGWPFSKRMAVPLVGAVSFVKVAMERLAPGGLALSLCLRVGAKGCW